MMKPSILIRSALFPALAALAAVTWGQSFEFNQMSYVDPSDPGEVQNISSRFEFDVDYTPSASTQFYNLYVNTPHGIEWAVQNMPLLSISDAGSSSPARFASYWDLGSGFTSPVTGMSASVMLSTTPLGAGDFGAFNNVGVAQTWRYGNGGVPSGDLGLGANPVASAPGANFGFNFRPGMPNVIQQKNFCGPGSAANSLVWLANQNGLTLPDNLANLQTKLAGYMGNANTGNWDDAQVRGKLRYIKENNLPLEVHYVGGVKLPTAGNYTDANGTARNDGAVNWNWIKAEMDKGQDLMFMTDKHWVVAGGYITIGNNKYLVYRDDKYQKGAATTPAQQLENALRWSITRYDETNNTIDIGGWGHKTLRTVVATSPVPEPASLAALALGISLLIRRRKNN